MSRVFINSVCAWLLLVASSISAAEAPLADAAERNDAAAIQELIKQKGDVSAPQPDGMTALHWATYHDDVEVM
jgi:ankyrin repeat protein